jgi:hypothetical protein
LSTRGYRPEVVAQIDDVVLVADVIAGAHGITLGCNRRFAVGERLDPLAEYMAEHGHPAVRSRQMFFIM